MSCCNEELRRLEIGSADKMQQLDEAVREIKELVLELSSCQGKTATNENFNLRSKESKTRRGHPLIKQVTKEEILTFQLNG